MRFVVSPSRSPGRFPFSLTQLVVSLRHEPRKGSFWLRKNTQLLNSSIPADFSDVILKGWHRALGDLRRHLLHFGVNQPVGRQNGLAAQRIRLTFEVADRSACFFDQYDACGTVPRVQAEFPEAVEAPSGYVGQIHRRGAITAHTV